MVQVPFNTAVVWKKGGRIKTGIYYFPFYRNNAGDLFHLQGLLSGNAKIRNGPAKIRRQHTCLFQLNAVDILTCCYPVIQKYILWSLDWLSINKNVPAL